MRFVFSMLKRIRAAYRPDAVHAEISEELRFHLDMKAAELVRQGMQPGDANAAAARAFGRFERVQEQGYDVRGGGLIEELFGDVRFGMRLLRKQWMKTAVLVLTLALGVGVNTAVFGVVRSVLLQPLPFRDAGELVILHQANLHQAGHGQAGGVSYPHFQDWRAASHSFRDMAVYSGTSATLTGRGEATTLFGAVASASLFRVLGVQPIRGRLFRDEEDRFVSRASSGGPVLISERLWHLRFGGRGDVIGPIAHLDGRAYEVIGVIGSGLGFPIQKEGMDYWGTVAVDADPSVYGGSIPVSRGYPRYDGVLARLNPGVTVSQARQEMTVVAKNVARAHPHATSSDDVVVLPALEEVVGTASRTMILILYGAVFCVLLVACMNVANILLVDALARRREFSVRLALGAPVMKLVRQLLVESTMVAVSGGLAGLLVAWFVLRLFLATAPPEMPRVPDIKLGPAVFFYVVGVSLICGLLFGCLPALAIRRQNLATFLKEGGRGVSKKASIWQPGPLLICGQIVLGMILTCCAGILVDSFRAMLHSSRGFNPHGVLTASVSLPIARYGQGSPHVVAYYRSLVQDLRGVPGVEAATISEVLPLSGQGNSTTLRIVGVAHAGLQSTDLRFVESSYFTALQIPLLSGRRFTDLDTAERPACAIVNQAFVRLYLGGRDPYRSQVKLGWGGDGPKQIVGVVGDIRHSATSPLAKPEIYVPFAQFPVNDMAILLRTSGDPYVLTTALRNSARRLDASVPIDRVRSLDDYLLLSSAQQHFLMWLLVAFAGATLVSTAIGLYGVLSDAVFSRAHEFGVRMALGSSASRVTASVLNQGFRLTAAGMALGAVGTVFASRLLQGWLYEAGRSDARAFVVSGGVLFVVALVACWVPSRRAGRVDLVALLRNE